MGEVTSEHKTIVMHRKLVRDRIPEVIEANGDTAECRVMTNDEFVDALISKLTEEAEELRTAESPADQLKELADLQEVLGKLIPAMGYQAYEVDTVQLAKRREAGGFNRRLWLESTTTVEEPAQ